MKTFIKKNLDIIILIIFIALVAGLGSLFVNLGMSWFNNLTTPKQWIPNFVIPIVWTTIYLLFAIIMSILFKQNLVNKKTIWLGIINGILNILWCLVFFTLQQLLLGAIIIIINTFFATALLIELAKIKKWYVNILWIYPIWIFIAPSLNIALWILN